MSGLKTHLDNLSTENKELKSAGDVHSHSSALQAGDGHWHLLLDLFQSGVASHPRAQAEPASLQHTPLVFEH